MVYNETASNILENETGEDIGTLGQMVDEIIPNNRMDHPLASGSNDFDAMVICPCSTSTAGKIHSGISDNLTTRLASVALKERRRLILVIRETPLSTPTLKAMFDLSSWGVVVMPASPPFYNLASDSITDLQKGFAGRIMDLLGIQNNITARYDPGKER
jgi:4-hydroxy-3-polyprenylbenzoate decarboxylase